MRKVHFRRKHASAGQSVIELAFILPILLILLLGVADFARAILFNNILVNMSREGANLAARTAPSPTQSRAQWAHSIIAAVTLDSLEFPSPMDMKRHGIVYIARVTGVDGGDGTVVARVEEQYRPIGDRDISLTSQLWSCPSWTDDSCNMPAGTAARVVTLPLPLALGDEVRVVETIYDYSPLSNYVMQTNPELYSQTLL